MKSRKPKQTLKSILKEYLVIGDAARRFNLDEKAVIKSAKNFVEFSGEGKYHDMVRDLLDIIESKHGVIECYEKEINDYAKADAELTYRMYNSLKTGGS